VAAILPTLLNLVLGFIIGIIVVGAVKLVEKIRGTSH
jgi:predicted DNA repair protein MutK